MSRVPLLFFSLFLAISSFAQENDNKWNQLLCNSITRGNYDSVQLHEALDHGADIHCDCLDWGERVAIGQSILKLKRKTKTVLKLRTDPLVVAYKSNQFSAIKDLLERGADPFYKSNSYNDFGLIKNIIRSKDIDALKKVRSFGVDLSKTHPDISLQLFDRKRMNNLSYVETNNIDLSKVYPNNNYNYDASKAYIASLKLSDYDLSSKEVKECSLVNDFAFLDQLKELGIQFKNTNLENIPSSTIINKYLELGASPSSINLYYFLNRTDVLKKYQDSGAKVLISWKQYLDLPEKDRQFVLKANFDPNTLYGDAYGLTSNIGVLDDLLEKGLYSKTDLKFKYERVSLLMFVLENYQTDHFSLIEKLLKQGVNINRMEKTYSIVYPRDRKKNGTPLSIAVSKDHSDLVNMFLDYGADPNQNLTESFYQEDPALIIALQNKNEVIIEDLVNHGADAFNEDIYYTSPWKYFKKRYPRNASNYSIVKKLLKKSKKMSN